MSICMAHMGSSLGRACGIVKIAVYKMVHGVADRVDGVWCVTQWLPYGVELTNPAVLIHRYDDHHPL